MRNPKRRGRPSRITWITWTTWIAWIKGVGVVLLASAVGTSAFAAYAGARAALASSHFQVKRVEWRGLGHRTEGAMMARIGPVIGRNLFRLDAGRIHRALRADPWVKAAVIRKHFPDTLQIGVVERRPAAVEMDARDRAVLRDAEGVVLERDGTYAPALPRLIHFQPAAFAQALALAPLLADRPQARIDLSDAEDIKVRMSGQVLHFGAGEYEGRWARFLLIENDLKRWGASEIDVDLRFAEKVVVRLTAPQTERYL